MYAILTRGTAQEVAAVLRGRDEQATVRVVEAGQGAGALDEAARVPVDSLVLDVATGPGLGAAVLRYRLARPQTRLIVLAAGRQPGDPEVAGVVQAGCYDIVTDLAQLPAVLDRPPAGLEQAALWLDPSLAPGKTATETVKIRERIVERRVATSARPVLVAVAGVADGVGTTTLAAAIAAYLARAGYKALLVEANGRHDLAPAAGMAMDTAGVQPWLPGLELLPAAGAEAGREATRLRTHEYVVADCGTVQRSGLSALDGDLTLIVLPASPSRWSRVLDWLRSTGPSTALPAGSRYVMLTVDTNLLAGAEEFFSQFAARAEVSLVPIQAESDWPPGWKRPNQPTERALAALLGAIMPDRPRRKRWPLLAATRPHQARKTSSVLVRAASAVVHGAFAVVQGIFGLVGAVLRALMAVATAAGGLAETLLYVLVLALVVMLVLYMAAPGTASTVWYLLRTAVEPVVRTLTKGG
ncbi:MAG: hypothetical protein ACM3ZA_06165 [Bacillota bacterium]